MEGGAAMKGTILTPEQKARILGDPVDRFACVEDLERRFRECPTTANLIVWSDAVGRETYRLCLEAERLFERQEKGLNRSPQR